MTLTDSDVRAKLIMAFSTYRRGEREPISFGDEVRRTTAALSAFAKMCASC
jgi:hypothetical protein